MVSSTTPSTNTGSSIREVEHNYQFHAAILRCETRDGFFLKQPFNELYMKKKLPIILGGLCILAFLLACCFTDPNGDPCAVNYILIAVAIILGIGSKITDKYGQLR